MPDLISAELLKVRTGRTWWYLAAAGVAMCLLTSYGYAVDGRDQLAQGGITTGEITANIARSWMMMFLFAGILGALSVVREYGGRTITRTALLAGSRSRVFAAKTTAGAAIGLAFGALAAVGAVLSPLAIMSTLGLTASWSTATTWVVVGVVACNVLAALWGGFLGWIIRNPIGAVATVVCLTLLVDPGLQRLVPEVAKFLFTIALSSLYGDEKPVLLGVWAAAACALVWLGVAGFSASRLFAARDID